MKKKGLLAVLLLSIMLVTALAMVACTPETTRVPAGPEAGVYYFEDIAGNESFVTLGGNKEFIFSVNNADKTGRYSLSGENLKLTFDDKSQAAITANYKDGVITLTYSGAEMRFLRKTAYTVTFNPNGGSNVADATVPNGKTLSKPASPVKPGYALIDWYRDSELKTPFIFDSDIITGDITLFARWGQTFVGQSEYTVKFDLNYSGAPAGPQSKSTIGGRLYNEPTPSSAPGGATFGGWWVSMVGDGSMLAYKWTEGMVFQENTTLYANWQTNPAFPVVEVSSTLISWTGGSGSSYRLDVDGPDGFTDIVNETVGGGAKERAINFAGYPAGDYYIKVTAAVTSSATERVYRNKALPKVSHYEIIDSTLHFKGVANATKYLIGIDCGNDLHNHSPIDNGSSTFYNFSNCPMPAEGITFTITAKADGWVSSVSEVITHKKNLDAISGFRVDDEQNLLWDEVPDATGYIVTDGGETIDIGNKTSYSLKGHGIGEVTITVLPKAKGYSSPAASEYTHDKKNLASPVITGILGRTVTWTNTGTTYELTVAGKTYTSDTHDFTADGNVVSFTLPNDLVLAPDTGYELKVMATGATASAWSDPVTVRGSMSEYLSLSYLQNVVTWSYVLGYNAYYVKVNDEPAERILGANRCEIELTKAGVNTIYVRADNEVIDLPWCSIDVYAYTVTLDGRGATVVGDDGEPTGQTVSKFTQLKAVGDKIVFPTLDMDGYDFAGWYNTLGGAASNGAEYTDTTLTFASDLMLYAYLTPEVRTVTYNAEGGTTTAPKGKVTYGSSYTLDIPSATTATKSGFIGWYDEHGIQLTDELGKSLDIWDSTEDITVFARWADLFDFAPATSSANIGTWLVKKGDDVGMVKTLLIPTEYDGVAVTEVSDFQSCYNLITIELHAGITYINSSAFNDSTNLTAINVNPLNPVYSSKDGLLLQRSISGGEEIVELAFCPFGKTTVVIPGSVTDIRAPLRDHSKLTTVIISGSVAYLAPDAFTGCTNLTTVIFEGVGLETLPVSAFAGLINLKNITLPSGLKTVGESAFEGCTGLTTVTFRKEDSLPLVIGKNAFAGCGELATVNFEGGKRPVTLSDNVFIGCHSLTSVTIPGLAGFGAAAFGKADMSRTNSSGIASINVAADNTNYISIDGVLFADHGNGELELVLYPVAKSGAYTIPANVTSIGAGAFSGCLGLTEIEIPANVTSIGAGAFSGCYGAVSGGGYSGLTSVIFASGSELTELPTSLFENCISLGTVTLPGGIIKINEKVFSNCSNLTSISFPGITAQAGIIKLPDTLKIIGNSAFAQCRRLTSVTIPANVESIGTGAFQSCYSSIYNNEGVLQSTIGLEEVIFETTKLTEIPNSLFYGCGKLTDIILPAGITSIGSFSFYGCAAFTSITIPANVKTIGNYAFQDCALNESTGLKDVMFENGSLLQTISNNAFEGCTALVNIGELSDSDPASIGDLPAGLLTIGDYAFNNCKSLVRFVIPAGVTSIQSHTFNGCPNINLEVDANNKSFRIHDSVIYNMAETEVLYIPSSITSIRLPSAMTIIPDRIFSGKANLETVTIHEGVTTIDYQAFQGCSNLETVIFENPSLSQLTTINNSAFANCRRLKNIELPDNLTTIDSSAFYNCSALEIIKIPKSTTTIHASAFNGCTSLTRVEVDVANEKYSSPDNKALFNKAATELMRFMSSAATYTIPSGVTTINASAFSGNTTLTSITIPDNVTTIKASAFYNCSYLVSVTIPDTVTTMENNIFESCRRLETVTFLGTSTLTSIGEQVFRGCSALESITLPNSLTSIGLYAFAECSSLTSINIPANVTSIGDRAFQGSGIQTVTFAIGSKLTSIGLSAFYECKSLTSISLPYGLTTIGNLAFQSCVKLTRMEIPKTVTTIGNSTFAYCSGLKAIIFATNSELQQIGDYAFRNCTGIKDIIIYGNSNLTFGSIPFIGWTLDSTGNATIEQYIWLPKHDSSYTFGPTWNAINHGPNGYTYLPDSNIMFASEISGNLPDLSERGLPSPTED